MDSLEQLLLPLLNARLAPQPEPNFYNLAGRGYLENPTSDLMAFFMGDGGPSWLAKALLQCLTDQGHARDHLPAVQAFSLDVAREVAVRGDGAGSPKRLDMLVSGPGFVLAIENKVFHHARDNPFHLYEQVIARYGGERLKCILQPDHRPHDGPPDWPVVTYQALARTALQRYGTDVVPASSKWEPFYREFLLHLQALGSRTGGQSMDADNLALAMKHFQALLTARSLLEQFQDELKSRGRVELERVLAGRAEAAIDAKVLPWGDAWAIAFTPRCWARGSRLYLAMDHSSEGAHVCFWIDCYSPVGERAEGEALVKLFRQASETTDRWLLDPEEPDSVTWEAQRNGTGEFGISVWPVDCADMASTLQALAAVARWFEEHVEAGVR